MKDNWATIMDIAEEVYIWLQRHPEVTQRGDYYSYLNPYNTAVNTALEADPVTEEHVTAVRNAATALMQLR